VSKTLVIYAVSFVVHGAIAASVLSLDKPTRRETIAISMAESEKKKPNADPPKPADLPKPPVEAKAAAPRQARAKAAPVEAKAPPPQVNAPAPAAGALDSLPDFGLSLGNAGGPGGMAVPSGGGEAARGAGPIAKETSHVSRTLAPKPDDGGCSDPPVKPKPKAIAQPAYTTAAREAGIKGKVRVEVTVDETGRVTTVRLLSGLGYGLDEVALDAARRATFEPGTRCGKAVRATFSIAMRFDLP
jgi:protein TonB